MFLLGVFWARTNESGAFWGLMFGFLLGMIRFGLEFGYFKPPCGSPIPDERPDFVRHFVDDIHYLHYGAILFLVTGAVTVIISLMTEPIPEEKLYRLTFWTRKSAEVRNGFDDDTDQQEDIQEKNSLNADQVKGFKRIIYNICGISQSSSNAPKPPKKSREEEAREAAEFLTEKSSLKIILNIAAVLSMSLACFVVAFYA